MDDPHVCLEIAERDGIDHARLSELRAGRIRDEDFSLSGDGMVWMPSVVAGGRFPGRIPWFDNQCAQLRLVRSEASRADRRDSAGGCAL